MDTPLSWSHPGKVGTAPGLISLTYLSLATEPLDDTALGELLAVSRDRNERHGVTGLLLYADAQFVQTLEGTERDVEETMSRIRVDPRHRDLDVTLVEEIEERFFPEWSMGFRPLRPEELAEVRGWSDYMGAGGRADEVDRGHAGIFHRLFRDSLRSRRRP